MKIIMRTSAFDAVSAQAAALATMAGAGRWNGRWAVVVRHSGAVELLSPFVDGSYGNVVAVIRVLASQAECR